jgi:uncharacterized protein
MTGTEALDRRGLQVLGFDECIERLRRTPVGRVSFVHDGEPVIFPVNHGVDGSAVVFRTQQGSKMDVAVAAGVVAYEIDDYDSRAGTGWSVLVKGSAEVVYDAADTARYDALGVRSWADVEGRGSWIRIRPTEISGRQISG